MKLCIAEKPSVAKDIAHVIGAKSRKDGYWEGNGYYVSWTFGHLCTLKEPGDYLEQWQRWDLNSLPMLPERFGIKLIENPGVKKQFDTITTLISKSERVINCGDAGQEGELIQRWVLAKAKNDKPLKRLWISSLTEEAIKEGFDRLEDGTKYDNLYAAGSARAIGDWVLGMNATRLFTLKFGENKQVLSIGRVQTPTLALIVHRQALIDNFVSETYFELKTVYRDTVFSSTKGKIKALETGEELVQSIADHKFEIDTYEQKEGKEQPPRLFDLTSLQVECNKKLGFSAEETLQHAQKLYENKFITYPRVDTTYLTNDLYKKIPTILEKLKPYRKLIEKLLTKRIRKSKKLFDDKKVTDHHAIIPTGIVPKEVSLEQKKVFDVITKRFIAAFYPDCKISNTTVLGNVKDIKFKATGKQILELGWREVFMDEKKKTTPSKKEEEQVIPIFTPGEKGVHLPQLHKKQTKAPSHYTEASLLRAMETAGKDVQDETLRDLLKENGIGRPSTRANIIETLFKRKYIVRQKRKLLATETGKHLISLIENDTLKSAELTGKWERKLKDIERGTYLVEDFKKELFEMLSQLVVQVKRQTNIPQKIKCPKCNDGNILTGKAAWGCSNFKKTCQFFIPFEFEGIKLSDREMKMLIRHGETHYRYQLKKGKTKRLRKIGLDKKKWGLKIN